MSTKSFYITHCRLAFPDCLVSGSILVEDEIISGIWLGQAGTGAPAGAEVVDAHNLIVAPGLVDIHNHGAVTHDFVAANAEGNNRALRFHAENGVTSMLATVMTETHEQMSAALQLLGEQHAAGEIYPNFLGIHVEGPYFAHEKRGAHKAECLRDPVRSEYEKFWDLSRGLIRVFTHAPERKGSQEFCRFFHERGAVPAIGHTIATLAQIRAAGAYGARHFVHANNAIGWPERRLCDESWLSTEMMGMGTLLSDTSFTGEIIADGYHVPLEMIRLFLSARGSDSFAIVSDSSSAVGCPPGEYMLGGIRIQMREGRLVVSTEGEINGAKPLGGSGTQMLLMIRNFLRWGFGLTTALKMSTLVPARIVGESRRGLLRVGHFADLIFIDDAAELFATIGRGRALYLSPEAPFTMDQRESARAA
jgi:N-acetylglucosamine-6-phosphate deacetylase